MYSVCFYYLVFVLVLILSVIKIALNLLSNFQVDINNLEEYISMVVEATVKTGIMRQMEAFRAGFNQVICCLNKFM